MRLQGLDAVRFLAFCGMVLVNFRIAAEVTPRADWASVLTNALEGRSAALFVVLAGIGVTLAAAPSLLMLKRAAFLMIIGLINMSMFDADILHFYALYFLVAILFMNATNRGLWMGVIGIVGVSLLLHLVLDYDRSWDWDSYIYSDFWTLTGFLRHSFFNGWHPVFPWAALLLIGMALGRMDLSAKTTQLRLVIFGAFVALVAALPQHLTSDPELIYLLDTQVIPPGPFYVMAGAGSAAAVIGLVLLAEPVLARWRVLTWLTAPGR